jgi:hypothetical protein
MRISLAILLTASSLLIPNFASAWGSAGHMVIAAEAYRGLSPELKAQAFDVLKAHPDFQKWTNAYHPNPNFDLPACVFMRSSTWPDDIRRSGNKSDHPNSYPLRPPNFAFEEDARPQDDILFGIKQCEQTLSDTNADPELRAAYLFWLVHLIEDLHQPLHCESLFDADYPNGDKGGNDFYVMPAQRVVGLHSIWDGLLGSAANPRTQWNYAVELETKFPSPSLPELTQHTTPKDWSLESREFAIDVGYLHGDLKGSTSRDSAPPLPADYTKNAKVVAEKQGALAGDRLASEIEKYLKDATVPLLPTNAVVATESAPKRVGALEASKYYDELMIVTGKVMQVSALATITILDIDGLGRSAPFTAVIFAENVDRFENLQGLKNQDVEISGTVTEYRGKPEIVLESPDQVKVLSRR